VKEGVPSGLAKGDEIGLWNVQKRPGEGNRTKRGECGHAGETGGPAAAGEAEEDSFGLIVGVVRGNYVVGPDRGRALR
jgi:hypothetical protein